MADHQMQPRVVLKNKEQVCLYISSYYHHYVLPRDALVVGCARLVCV